MTRFTADQIQELESVLLDTDRNKEFRAEMETVLGFATAYKKLDKERLSQKGTEKALRKLKKAVKKSMEEMKLQWKAMDQKLRNSVAAATEGWNPNKLNVVLSVLEDLESYQGNEAWRRARAKVRGPSFGQYGCICLP